MPDETFTERLNVLLPKRLMRQVRSYARREEISMGDLTRSALADFLMQQALRAAPVPQEPRNA